MEKAWSILGELGAVDEEGKLTPLGRHMVITRPSSTPTLLSTYYTVDAACRSSTREGLSLNIKAPIRYAELRLDAYSRNSVSMSWSSPDNRSVLIVKTFISQPYG